MNIQTTSTDGTVTMTMSGQLTLSRAAIEDRLRNLQACPATPQAAALPQRQGLERLADTMRETADLLGVSYITVYRLLQRGLLRCSPALRHKAIPRKEIERLLNDTVRVPWRHCRACDPPAPTAVFSNVAGPDSATAVSRAGATAR